MNKSFLAAVLFAMCSLAGDSMAQSARQRGLETASLCALQKKVGEGKQENVRVSGMYGPGLSDAILEGTTCPGEGTWVELALRSPENLEKLRKLLDRSRRAYVVVEGQFYGPPLPDPKLPEAIRNSYHPGWGHLAAFRTKLVVHAIRDVKATPPNTAMP